MTSDGGTPGCIDARENTSFAPAPAAATTPSTPSLVGRWVDDQIRHRFAAATKAAQGGGSKGSLREVAREVDSESQLRLVTYRGTHTRTHSTHTYLLAHVDKLINTFPHSATEL